MGRLQSVFLLYWNWEVLNIKMRVKYGIFVGVWVNRIRYVIYVNIRK
jgi:hypothetical protein